MYWDVEISPEDEDEMIGKIAEVIHKYDMDLVGILLVNSLKPVAYVGTQMGRLLVSPFLSVLGDEIGMTGEKFLKIFEKRENVQKLIDKLAEQGKDNGEKSKDEDKKIDEEKPKDNAEPKKKGWKRFLPFS